MFKFLAKLGVIGLTLGLMIYSSIRTFDFLQDTLPAGSEALAVFGVMAYDLALMIWLLTFMFDAEGAGQRGIAAAMVLFQLVAVLTGFGGDSLLRSAENGLITAIDDQTRRMILYATIVVIFVNVAAATFYHLLSPANRVRMRHEGYRDKIEAKAHEKADADVDLLATQLAKQMSDSTMRQLAARYESTIAQQESETARWRGAPALPDPNREPDNKLIEQIVKQLGLNVPQAEPALPQEEMRVFASEGARDPKV